MEPKHTCTGCRNHGPQSHMTRMVHIGDGIAGAARPRPPGRGIYLHVGCLRPAEKRQALCRALGPGALLVDSLRIRLSQKPPIGI